MPRRRRKLIYLLGFMGSGKSTVGALLARELGWPFIDLDATIEAARGQTVREIFEREGEAPFRVMEHAVLTEASKSEPAVIALGGGTFVQTGNAALLLEQTGVQTVFLDAPAEELFRRCQQEQLERPLQRDLEQFRQLYQTRRPYYTTAALRIETSGKDVEAVAAEVACSLGFSRNVDLKER